MVERADAARNRATVLAAAEELFRREDLEHVTLEQVAHAAGVGKATVLRRFGGLLGLVEALVADRVTALQHQVRHGAPPLGPGGQDGYAHLHAYVDALFDFVLDNRKLIRALEVHGPYAYYANPASRFWVDELARRIGGTRPGIDTVYLAHAVFTAMRADVIDYLRRHQQMDTDRIRDGLHTLADPGRSDGRTPMSHQPGAQPHH